MIKKQAIFFYLLLITLIGSSLYFIPAISNLFSMSNLGSNQNSESESFVSLSNHGSINASENEIFWFIHVTDTQDIWYNEDRIDNWYELLNESYNTILPSFIYNTGDLVNSDYHNFLTANERDQRVEEWERYEKSLKENGMNSSIYMDVMGNHDAYGDPEYQYFLEYSIMGSEFDTLQYSFKRRFTFGEYAFIGLHTPEDFGIRYPFGLFGYLNTPELDWYEQELKKYHDCDRIFIFGHHPPFELYSAFSSSGKTFFQLNEEFDVDYYFVGHGHSNTFQNINGMLAIETEKFSHNDGTYRIVALDNNQLSTSLEHVGQWPQSIITNPTIKDYMTQNLDDIKKIRVLAWDPKGIDSVEWSAYTPDGNIKLRDWKDLSNSTNDMNLWEGNWDDLENELIEINDLSSMLIKVRTQGGSGENIEEMIYSPSVQPYFGWYQAIPIIYISFFGFIGIIIIITSYLRLKIPKFKKTPEIEVDHSLRNLYLLKCLVFLAVPMTFGAMYVGQITAVFSLFYLNFWGIHFNGTLLIYSGTIFLFSIFWQGFALSYKHRTAMMIESTISATWLIFILVFYILHFPSLSWISPGLYLMIGLDFLLFRKARNLRARED